MSLPSGPQIFLVSQVNYIYEGDILMFFAALNSSETEIPTPSLPGCSQKTIPPSADSFPYFLYHCPAATVEKSLLLPDLDITVDFGPLLTGLSGMSQLSARTQLPLVIGLSNTLYDDLNLYSARNIHSWRKHGCALYCGYSSSEC